MKGVYVLVISVSENIKVNVGRLGAVTFPKGLYAYVGSAQNNLEKRVARHQRRSKKIFWHIDHLLNNKSVEVAEVFWKETGKAEECTTAKKMSEGGLPIAGFGCSDCSCGSHLFMLENSELSGGSMAFLTKNLRRLTQV